MKTYVVGTHMKCLSKVRLMNIHNICFHEKKKKKNINTFWLEKKTQQNKPKKKKKEKKKIK